MFLIIISILLAASIIGGYFWAMADKSSSGYDGLARLAISGMVVSILFWIWLFALNVWAGIVLGVIVVCSSLLMEASDAYQNRCRAKEGPKTWGEAMAAKQQKVVKVFGSRKSKEEYENDAHK